MFMLRHKIFSAARGAQQYAYPLLPSVPRVSSTVVVPHGLCGGGVVVVVGDYALSLLRRRARNRSQGRYARTPVCLHADNDRSLLGYNAGACRTTESTERPATGLMMQVLSTGPRQPNVLLLDQSRDASAAQEAGVQHYQFVPFTVDACQQSMNMANDSREDEATYLAMPNVMRAVCSDIKHVKPARYSHQSLV